MLITESEATTGHCRLGMAPLTKLLVAAAAILWTAMPAFAQAPMHGKDKLGVMTYNVYEGAHLNGAFRAQNQEDFVKAVSQILASVHASRPPARAAAVARQIGKAQPTLVALQEATEWRTCPADELFTKCTAPPTVLYDLLDLIKDSLQHQGYSYKEVARVTTNKIQGPAITKSGRVIVLYEQRSAILARADIDPHVLQLSKVQSGPFDAKLTMNIGGIPLDVHRAWVSVDVKYHDTSFRFIDTQLEAFDPNVNHSQAEELLAGPAKVAEPVVLAMDSNSRANLPRNATSPTYCYFLQRGFTDAWTQAEGDSPGLTCCLRSTRPNHPSTVIKRIDLILLHGNLKAESAQVVGGKVSDKTSGLWPSDHIGVAAWLKEK